MTESEIKQTLEKFRKIANENKQLNTALINNVQMSTQYIGSKYRGNDLIEKEIEAILEASNLCFELYKKTYNVNFDSSIYSLCVLGAALAADNFMYENNIRKIMTPIAMKKNGGMTDSDFGEIKAFQNLVKLHGNPKGVN